LEQINRVLARLEKGEDLHPGLLGISLKGGDPFTDEPVIAACHPKSPAAEAGLKAGDRIAEIDGVKVNSQSELKHQLSPRYAGEKVMVVVLRDKERLERPVDLIAKLQPYIHPFLGILPRRGEAKSAAKADEAKPDADAKPTGVVVRDVYPDSPA